MTKPTPYYQSERVTLYCGDSLSVLPTLGAGSVDAVVTDPPYGLSFMGKHWDYDVPGVGLWAACLGALKPGGHLLAFSGTRTQHRMAVNIEDAGFDIRDMIAWVYGSGFPKSLDVSKAIDKAAGAEREVVGEKFAGMGSGKTFGMLQSEGHNALATKTVSITAPATPAARRWSGWGTALKPAMEPITVARKPLDGTVADNVLRHGTGAINVEGCRVPGTDHAAAWDRPVSTNIGAGSYISDGTQHTVDISANKPSGRWPANLIHDGSDEVVAGFPFSKDGVAGKRNGVAHVTLHGLGKRDEVWGGYGGEGSAARFFYCPKASKADRDEGCESIIGRFAPTMGNGIGGKEHDPETATPKRNHHPTVKPTDLMRYLCRLVTPPSGVVLDPFCGSGSTGKAAMLEGFQFIGIEREEAYCEIAAKRIQAAERDNAERLVSA